MGNNETKTLLKFVEVAAGERNSKEAYNVEDFKSEMKQIANEVIDVTKDARRIDEDNVNFLNSAIIQMKQIHTVLNNKEIHANVKVLMVLLIEHSFENSEKKEITLTNDEFKYLMGWDKDLAAHSVARTVDRALSSLEAVGFIKVSYTGSDEDQVRTIEITI